VLDGAARLSIPLLEQFVLVLVVDLNMLCFYSVKQKSILQTPIKAALITSLKLMTHSPDFGADFWTVCHADLVPDFSGTMILAPVGCVFYFVPISGMHVTTTAIGDWSMPSFSFCLYSLVILLFIVCFFCTLNY